MPTTLLGYVRTLPALGGRVSYLTAPGTDGKTPGTPYAVVFTIPGRVAASYYGHADTLLDYHCVTVYDRPLQGESMADSALRLMNIFTSLDGALGVVDTDMDGVTPLLIGSFQRSSPPARVLPDPDNRGGVFGTYRFSAMTQRP